MSILESWPLRALFARTLNFDQNELEDCPIAWAPSVFAPVFYGVREYSVHLRPDQVVSLTSTALDVETAQPLPGSIAVRFRVFFPSLDGSPFNAPMLRGCGRHPLILFAHGHCSKETDHFSNWYELPATLARCGNVVVVPDLPKTRTGTRPFDNDEEVELLRRLIIWMRRDWEHHGFIMPAPATGLIGHSFGAGLTARLVEQNIVQTKAYASLSGHSPQPVRHLQLPKLLVWGTGIDDVGQLVPIANWASEFVAPVHVIELDEAAHWDYIPQARAVCARDYGPCGLFPFLVSDAVALFFARYLLPEGARKHVGNLPSWLPYFRVAASLRPPPLLLTQEQHFFAGGHLAAWDLLGNKTECGMTLNWKTASSTGSFRPS